MKVNLLVKIENHASGLAPSGETVCKNSGAIRVPSRAAACRGYGRAQSYPAALPVAFRKSEVFHLRFRLWKVTWRHVCCPTTHKQSIAVVPFGVEDVRSSTTFSDLRSSATRAHHSGCCFGGWNFIANKIPGARPARTSSATFSRTHSCNCFSIAARSGKLSRFLRVCWFCASDHASPASRRHLKPLIRIFHCTHVFSGNWFLGVSGAFSAKGASLSASAARLH